MLNIATRNFIREHAGDDPARLALAARRYPDVDVPAAVVQVEALQKIRTKIPSWYRFDLTFPARLSVEQSSSEQTARFKAGMFSGGRMADLTGGMGVDAYFFAQQFRQVMYVEQNPELVALARSNFTALGADNIEVAHADAEQFLQTTTDSFDLFYLDPARRDDRLRRVFRLADCTPNVPRLLPLLLGRAPRVLIKAAPLLDLDSATEDLKTVVQIWVVAIQNEVKEVLYLLERTPARAEQVPITAVNLGADFSAFTFTRQEEQQAKPAYSPPLRYLYEPNAAILKAGAFKTFAARFGLAKLHPNTHLYTSGTLVPEVPGRVFEIAGIVRYDRKAVQALLPDGRGNVAARNFPDTAEVMRKKLGLRDGGDWYVFGLRDAEERPLVVVGRRV